MFGKTVKLQRGSYNYKPGNAQQLNESLVKYMYLGADIVNRRRSALCGRRRDINLFFFSENQEQRVSDIDLDDFENRAN